MERGDERRLSKGKRHEKNGEREKNEREV